MILVVCLTSCGEDKEIGSYDIESITKDSETMTANGETLSYTFKDNKISMGEDGDGMVFVKKN